ncbi:MAG: DUF192 domain-containing protein [Dehalococcoidia bacterium]|nr:DUF192 domain-containing protein [Dehalococcoidia bacterium]
MKWPFLTVGLLLVTLACTPGVTVAPASPTAIPTLVSTLTQPPPTLTPAPTQSPPFLPKAVLGNHVFYLEIADTAEEQARGFMERPALPLDRAMLFVYEAEGPWVFWMKNTLIPLDILWMSSTLEVVDIQTMHPEPGKTDAALTRYLSRAPARYVLEMNAGLAQAYQLSRGMKVTLHLAEE